MSTSHKRKPRDQFRRWLDLAVIFWPVLGVGLFIYRLCFFESSGLDTAAQIILCPAPEQRIALSLQWYPLGNRSTSWQPPSAALLAWDKSPPIIVESAPWGGFHKLFHSGENSQQLLIDASFRGGPSILGPAALSKELLLSPPRLEWRELYRLAEQSADSQELLWFFPAQYPAVGVEASWFAEYRQNNQPCSACNLQLILPGERDPRNLSTNSKGRLSFQFAAPSAAFSYELKARNSNHALIGKLNASEGEWQWSAERKEFIAPGSQDELFVSWWKNRKKLAFKSIELELDNPKGQRHGKIHSVDIPDGSWLSAASEFAPPNGSVLLRAEPRAAEELANFYHTHHEDTAFDDLAHAAGFGSARIFEAIAWDSGEQSRERLQELHEDWRQKSSFGLGLFALIQIIFQWVNARLNRFEQGGSAVRPAAIPLGKDSKLLSFLLGISVPVALLGLALYSWVYGAG